MRYTSVFIISLLILSSCSHKNEAIELSRDFFTSLSDTTYGKPSDFYPQYDSLGIEAKSDIVDIDESDVTEKNDTITVRCYNNYTNSEGTFKQDSVTLFITRNEDKQFYIYDSKGLIEMDKELEWFGTVTGAFTKKRPNDQTLAKRIEKVRDMMFAKYFEVRADLATKVKIANWSWETSYSGDAHGEGRVVNNLDYSISVTAVVSSWQMTMEVSARRYYQERNTISPSGVQMLNIRIQRVLGLISRTTWY